MVHNMEMFMENITVRMDIIMDMSGSVLSL